MEPIELPDLTGLSEAELQERNIALGQQKDVIMGARREIARELDRRADIERTAKLLASLPAEIRAGALAAAEPEIAARVAEIVAADPGVPEQVLAPDGVASSFAAGEPG